MKKKTRKIIRCRLFNKQISCITLQVQLDLLQRATLKNIKIKAPIMLIEDPTTSKTAV